MIDRDYITMSKAYRKVIEHRHNCRHWKNHTFCIDCFGGGLVKFFEDLIREREGYEL